VSNSVNIQKLFLSLGSEMRLIHSIYITQYSLCGGLKVDSTSIV